VNIRCTLLLLGKAYRWKFFAPRPCLTLWLSLRSSNVSVASTTPLRATMIMPLFNTARGSLLIPNLSPPPLVNIEAVHQALVIQAIIGAPYQTDHARDKIPGRTSVLGAWVAQPSCGQ
jgi:hypothetical protein